MSIQESLGRLADLKPNWDSYGALAIDAEAISAAQSFVSSLDPDLQPTRVSPMRSGGVQLAWGDENLEMEFRDDGTIQYLESHEGSLLVGDTDRAEWLIRGYMSRGLELSGVGEK